MYEKMNEEKKVPVML